MGAGGRALTRCRSGAGDGGDERAQDGQGGQEAHSARLHIRGFGPDQLGELRDLSRGLRPALLQERGLGTAIEALAQRSPLSVSFTAIGTIEQTPEAVRTAAYFVVAEALTNAAKHGGATSARISIERASASLMATVADDGHGGADPDGSGLTGLSKRVRALDGRLDVVSPAGGPTIVTAEIPCE